MQRITRPAGPFDHPILKGGAGSGNHDHAGRPGERGGSAEGAGSPLHEAPVGAFHAAFEKAFAGSEYKSFVTHYSPEDLAKMKAIVTTPDGKAGFAVLGPAAYVRSDWYAKAIAKIAAGESAVVKYAPAGIPLAQLIAVALQTDYAGWLGHQEMLGWDKKVLKA